jgi:alpha-L-rhamnosidase
LHDYFMYRSDHEFVESTLHGTREVMNFFARRQSSDGSLKNVPYWIFTDWTQGTGWNFGMAPVGKNGESSILDMQLLWVYQLAGEMENQLGLKDLAAQYKGKADQLKATIQRKYWDSNRGLYADTEDKDVFSQHANSLAILSGVISEDKASELANKILSDTTLVPASIYFKYYLHQALVKAGLGDSYLKWLDKWRENISLGLSTWAETSDVNTSRSDCHAWGSSPNIEFYRTILGISSEAPGFSKIKVEPHLGDLKNIGGEMPHPKGTIVVKYNLQKGALQAEIDLPQNTEGTFIWKGQKHIMKGGKNNFKL